MEILWGTIALQIVAFTILFLLLWKFAFGPLVNLMNKRQEKIEEQITTAENNMVESEKTLKQQNEVFAKARIEAQEIIERAQISSSKQADELIVVAKAEAKRLKEQAVLDIQHEKDKAIIELRNEVGSLSVLIASKMIEKELDINEQSKFIDEMIKEAGDVQ